MKQKLAGAAVALSLISISSCETDFDVTAPYKEFTIVHGLLDVSDTMQWIRINKSYLGDGDALVMAQHPDSINYPDILDVSLEEYYGNIHIRTLSLQRDSSVVKEEGTFAAAPNILYRLHDGDKINAGDTTYKLVIHNLQTDSVVTATTAVVDPFEIDNPKVSNVFKINWISSSPYEVRWYPSPDGAAYQLTIRFNYTEINIFNNDTVQKYADWVFPKMTFDPDNVPTKIPLQIEGESFYYFVASVVKPDNSLKRKFVSLDFTIACGAEEFETYMTVNQPAVGLNQNIVQYTNINGGFGIFSSRVVQQVKNKDMYQDSIDELIHGSITGNLGFY